MKGFSGVSSFFVAVVLCFLGGYGLGGGFSGGVDVVENDEVVSSERERRVGVGQELVFGVGGVERMCELVEGRGGVLRVLEVQVGVGGMGREELEELWAFAVPRLNFGIEDDFEIGAAILARMAVLDPERALALAEEGGAHQNQLTREVAAEWSRTDLDGALEWIAGSGSGVREMALRAVLERMGDEDRAGALAVFREQVEKGVMGRRAWEGEDFFREWTKEAGAVGVEAALAHAEFTGRRGGLRGAVETWGRLEPELALAWLEGKAGVLTPEEQKVLLVRMVGGWSDRKPGESAEYVMGLEDEELFKSASEQVLRDWAAVDFEAAGTFVDGVEGNRQRQRRMEDQLVWAGRVRGNRAQALDYALEKYPENKLVSHSLYMVASEIIGNDPAGHVEWVRETTPDARMEEELFNTLLHQWRGIDRGEAARNWHLMPDPVRRANGYEFIAGYWAAEDLDAAREWANGLEEGPERERALTGVVTAWMGEDREGAQEWIGTLEEGELRDRTTSQLIPMMVKDDLAGALKLAEGLSHPHRRDDTLEYVMREWMKEDRAEAEVAIRSHEGLSEMARWRLLAGVEVER